MDKLCFYSKSKDCAPGKGVNEVTSKEYNELSKIKNWRQILSNFHISEFKYDNFTFRSVEHAFQYEKIKLVNGFTAFNFTKESNSNLGNGDGLEARKNRKIILLTDEQLAYWSSIKYSKMDDIVFARFSQNEKDREVLLLTKDAELWHSVVRGKPMRMLSHERARLLLK